MPSRLRSLAGIVMGVGAIASSMAAPIISEFMASNGVTITDQDGYSGDWLEIYNPDPTPVDLTGWYLTNSATNLGKWAIPPLALQPGQSVVIFCSSKNYTDPAAPYATNFNISEAGGYLALVRSDKTTVVSSYTFPVQYPDVSYGVSQPTNPSETPQVGFLASATPGATNGGLGSVLLAGRVTISTPPGIFAGSTTVTLTGATGTDRIRYVLGAPSPTAGAAVPPPSATSQLYAGPITITSSTLLRAAVFSSDDKQHGFPSSALYIQLDTTSANRLDTFRSTMPIIVVDDNGFGLLPKDDLFYRSWLGAYSVTSSNTASLLQAPDFFTSQTMKNHGYSSSAFPKQSYEFSLTNDLGQNAPRTFFGMSSDRSWDAISPWSIDKTYVHNAFVYSLARGMGYWAPSTKFAQLFIHSGGGPLDSTSFAGITILTERIKVTARRVNIASLSASDITAPDVTGGYILRFDHPDDHLAYYAWTTDHGISLTIDTPKLNVIVPAQVDYITDYVQRMEDAMVADRAGGYATHNYLSFIDRSSWVDYHLLNVFVENNDAFLYSEYFNKDINGPIKAGPVWDYDRALNSADGRDINPEQWTPYNVGDFWDISWWTYATHDPDFMQSWVDRWQELRLSLLSTQNLTSLVDSLAAQIGPQAAALDSARWSANLSRYPGGWQGEVDQMKAWLTKRGQWIDSQFVAAPTVRTVANSVILTPATGVQLAYTLDGSDPRLPGGAVGSRTILTSSPVTLALNEVYFARSFDVRKVGTYPGSPWSSIVSFAGNTTGQLVNVSCRTQVGTGAGVLVAGFVVAGPADIPTQVLIRGVGPALSQYGVAGALTKPVLSIYDTTQRLLATNTIWSTGVNAALSQSTAQVVGAFALPNPGADSALVLSLKPGVYSAQVSGSGQTTGNGMVEVYQVSQDTLQVVNVSSRALVNAATGPLITGFVISQGPAQVLVRGIGPTLGAYGVPNPLALPKLLVYDSSSHLIASNSGWGNNMNAAKIDAVAAAIGAFQLPSGSADSALLLTLPPGAYSVHIVGPAGSTGVALVECYLVPPPAP